MQKFPSLQAIALALCVQPPLAGLQLSSVHGLPSSQLCGELPWQAPDRSQLSMSVHGLLSLQGPLAGVLVQTLATQPSAVQGFASSQLFPWPRHFPATQASWTVQPLPSSHLLPSAMALCWHANLGSQTSVVHGLKSLQSITSNPKHLPPWQTSSVVHTLPSEHKAALLTN